MALTKFAKMGVNRMSVSVLNNDSDYTFADTYREYENIPDSKALMLSVGTDLVPLFWTFEGGNSYDLITFKDGSKIQFDCSGFTTQWWGGNLFQYTRIEGGFKYVDSNNVVTWLVTNGEKLLSVSKDGETKQCHIYIAFGVDDDLQLGYMVAIYNNPLYGNRNFTGFGTCIMQAPYGTQRKTYYKLFTGNGTEYDADPWSNAGYAGIGGGEGTFDFTSDVIGLPELPSIDATNTGFLQLYSASLSQVRELAAYLWTNDFLTNLVKVTQDPLSIIMSLSMYPFAIPSTTTRRVCAGNVETPVSMAVPDKQFYEIDCGNFPVPSFYGAYLDYEPFSKCEIFLPYCGTHALSLDDIVGATLNVRYRVDLLSGSCVAFILVDGSVRYTFAGMCAMNIPITSQNFLSNYTAILGLAASSINALSAPTMSAASDVASNVMQCKPNISRGGGTASNMGFMGVQKPMLIFTVPRVAIPKGQAKHTGYPVFTTYKLSDLKGYTEIEAILTEDFGRATSAEVSEIDKLLRGGVIL